MINELVEILNDYWHGFIKLIPGLLVSIIILSLFLFLGNKISRFIKKKLIHKTNDLLFSNFIGRITKYIFLLFGFVISMEILGLASLASGVVAGAGISAVILGFAFKNIGENFLSGFLLAFNRPFNVGDLIESNGFTGTIISMDFRSTNIKTENGQDVFIPNSLIINNPLKNITKEGLRRFEFTIQVDYTSDVESAKKHILYAVSCVKEVLKEPIPIVVVDQLTTSVSIKAYYWINALNAERAILEVKGDVIEKSKEELYKGGIAISELTQIKITNDLIPIKLNS